MKKIISFAAACFFALAVIVQTETFDITTYTVPRGTLQITGLHDFLISPESPVFKG